MIGLHLDSNGVRVEPLPVAEQTSLEVGSGLVTVHRQLADEATAQRRLVADRVRITNRLTASLKLYFPQALDWLEDKATLVFCEFLEKWPTLQAANQARRDTLKRFFLEHNSRYHTVIDKRIEAIKSAIPLTDDTGVIAPNQLLVDTLVHQLPW
jgi:hypothetical protein